jgi:hypothetical protein
VLKYRPRHGDETFRARDEDNYAADIATTDIAAGRIDGGTHDSNDDGDAGNNTTTKCEACNTGRHFVKLDHDTDHCGTRRRWSRRWFTAARVRHACRVVAAPRIRHTGG